MNLPERVICRPTTIGINSTQSLTNSYTAMSILQLGLGEVIADIAEGVRGR